MSQTASLFLRASDLTLSTIKNFGSADRFGTTYKWNNINLRVLLGDMYDQYDRFKLNSNTIATNAVTNLGTATSYRCLYVTISGLPFVNNTYDVKKLQILILL